jgi:rubrerythrin
MGDLTALRLSITIEHDLHEFYGNASKKAADPDLKEMFDMLSQWEQNHQEILENQYNALKQEFWAEMGFEPF